MVPNTYALNCTIASRRPSLTIDQRFATKVDFHGEVRWLKMLHWFPLKRIAYPAVAITAIFRGQVDNVPGQLILVGLQRWNISLRSPCRLLAQRGEPSTAPSQHPSPSARRNRCGGGLANLTGCMWLSLRWPASKQKSDLSWPRVTVNVGRICNLPVQDVNSKPLDGT